MSPNEHQLRAALRHGEHDAPTPDPGSLIARAHRIRQERRRRVRVITGSIAAVAVIGVGIPTVLGGSRADSGGGAATAGSAAVGGATDRAAGGAGGARSAAHPSGAAAAPVPGGALPTSDGTAPATTSAAARACPAQPERFALPGGGGLGQFGSTDALFARPVAAVRVCAYPLRVSTGPRTQVLDGAAAASLVDVLETAPSRRTTATCPPNTDVVGGTIELLAADARGRALPVVVLTAGCRETVASNGTAVRYVVDVPASLLGLLATTPVRSPSR